MGSVIAIDPGNDTGWARFGSNGVLEACGLTVPTNLPLTVGGKVICECPQIYPDELYQPKKVSDIIKLACKVGRVQQFYETHGNLVETVLPRDWKKQVPKDIHQKRIEASLSSYEHALACAHLSPVNLSVRHNVWDAIGLGVWFTKRLGIRHA